MDIIKYKTGRALFIDSEDLMIMNSRLSEPSPLELAIRMIVDNRRNFGLCAVIVVTSLGFMSLPKFLRDALAEDDGMASVSYPNCFRTEWWT